jgi:hypothetical protein
MQGAKLPEDLRTALRQNPGQIRAHALEESLKYALAASHAVDLPGDKAPRAHVQAMSGVAQTWALLAAALHGGAP